MEYRKTAEIVDELHEEAVLIGTELDRHNEALEEGIKTVKAADKELKKANAELKKHS